MSPSLAVVFATALEPDFDAFFGALEVVAEVGFVLVLAVVMVFAARRFTSL